MSLSSNSEKGIRFYGSEVLKDENKRAKVVLGILSRETNRVSKEMEALDEAAKKLEHVHFSEVIALSFFFERHLILPPNAFLS